MVSNKFFCRPDSFYTKAVYKVACVLKPVFLCLRFWFYFKKPVFWLLRVKGLKSVGI